MSVNLNTIQGTTPIQLGSMDLETALMSVQSQRSQLLENSLKEQISSVQAKNDQIAALNQGMNASQTRLNEIDVAMPANDAKIAELKTMRDQLTQVRDRDPNGYTGLSWAWAGDDKGKSTEMLQRVRAEGLTDKGPAPRDVDKNGTMDAHGTTVSGWIDQLNAKIDGLTKKNQDMKAEQVTLKSGIADSKTQIDALSNSQQMDMLRLQSLSNKRNEAFDLMTNFIKKMQDSRSSILGNMR
ncbi:hypothetical protein [Acidovorax sp.]|jgi:chromosome segregation ATPase|uniref:hypothetical protein n=1 Tax=Acidovorax sp. TaxID=1872122 RepID=UPI00391F5FAB